MSSASANRLVGQFVHVAPQTFVGRPNSDGGVAIVTKVGIVMVFDGEDDIGESAMKLWQL